MDRSNLDAMEHFRDGAPSRWGWERTSYSEALALVLDALDTPDTQVAIIGTAREVHRLALAPLVETLGEEVLESRLGQRTILLRNRSVAAGYIWTRPEQLLGLRLRYLWILGAAPLDGAAFLRFLTGTGTIIQSP